MDWTREMLDSPFWLRSTAEQKAILLTLLLLSDQTDDGVIVASYKKIAEISGKGITDDKVRTAFKTMENLGVIEKVNPNQNPKGNPKGNPKATNSVKLVKSRLSEVDAKKLPKGNPKANPKGNPKAKPVVEKHQKYSENEELDKTILDFISNRKSLKKPMTDKAITLMLNKLDKLARTDAEKIEILNQSILNGWQGIFPLQGDRNGANKKQVNTNETDEIRAMWGFD